MWIIEATKDVEIVKLLMSDPRVNPADQNNQAIVKAAKGGHTETVKLLLSDPRVNPADQHHKAIILASENDHSGIIQLLISDPRIDPSCLNLLIINALANGRS